MVVRPGLGIGMDVYRASPDLLRSNPGQVDRGGSVHAGGLRRVGVELIALDHPHAIQLPIYRLVMMVVMFLAHDFAPLYKPLTVCV